MKIKIYKNRDSTVLSGLKGKTAIDAGCFYAPYIPLMISGVSTRISAQGELWGWTTFIVEGHGSEVIQWCMENFGRRHRGIYLNGLNLWLGNGGRWRYDGRSEYEIGLRPPYVRIWLHREEDIAMLKLRWG